jgi:UDP-2,3-diacylglucosamine pyrophosphatase LpxH
MLTTLFCISDLHLGGAPGEGDAPGFQMCPAAGQRQIAAFIRWAGAQRQDGQRVHLVLAGDIVDFLAEKEFQPFTASDTAAETKLREILKRTQEVFDALAEFVRDGGQLTLMLGNHDLELCFPRTRRLLLEHLGPGRVEFLYDNQAFTFGPVLIEHGNRYDAWNAVPHDLLRHARSNLSRGEPAHFRTLPGSEVVYQIVNELKAHYSFVDLLKPEDSGLLPLLALLDGRVWQHARDFVLQSWRASRVRYDQAQQPRDENYISAPPGEDERLIRSADEIATGGNPDEVGLQVGEPPFIERWAQADEKARQRRLGMLFKVLRDWVKTHDLAFAVEHEDKKYLKAATRSVEAGFQVVVYGHTHLVKRVELKVKVKGEEKTGVYLNTGTWADLMRLPEDVFTAPEDSARASLREFAEAIASNQLGPWRTRLPTFARIELESDDRDTWRLLGADVHFFDGEGQTPRVTTEEVARRLAVRKQGSQS